MTKKITNTLQYNSGDIYTLNDSRLDKYTRFSIDNTVASTPFNNDAFVPLCYINLQAPYDSSRSSQFCGTFLLEEYIDFKKSTVVQDENSLDSRLIHASSIITVDIAYNNSILQSYCTYVSAQISNLLDIPSFRVGTNIVEGNLKTVFYINNSFDSTTFSMKPLNIFTGDSSLFCNTYDDLNDGGHNLVNIPNELNGAENVETEYDEDYPEQYSISYIQCHVDTFSNSLTETNINNNYAQVTILGNMDNSIENLLATI